MAENQETTPPSDPGDAEETVLLVVYGDKITAEYLPATGAAAS